MGDHSHINNGTHRLSHFLPLIFTLTSAKNPSFYQKLSPKVLYFFHTFQNLGNFQRPQIGWNLRKRYPNALYFYGFCHLKTPYFLPCMHMFERNECCSLKQDLQKLENFVFLKQNRAIW